MTQLLRIDEDCNHNIGYYPEEREKVYYRNKQYYMRTPSGELTPCKARSANAARREYNAQFKTSAPTSTQYKQKPFGEKEFDDLIINISEHDSIDCKYHFGVLTPQGYFKYGFELLKDARGYAFQCYSPTKSGQSYPFNAAAKMQAEYKRLSC